jgi:hypothetical protein
MGTIETERRIGVKQIGTRDAVSGADFLLNLNPDGFAPSAANDLLSAAVEHDSDQDQL